MARKAVNYMKSTGIADTAYFGPELEFFIFDNVRYDQTQYSGYYFLDSVEGAWNTGREENAATSATSSATRKAISRCRRPMRCTTSAAR